MNTTLLNPYIPYFILLDSGSTSISNEIAEFRAEFEFYLSKNLSQINQNIPIVSLALGGSLKTLNTLRKSIENYQTPCVFIESCHESSDVFSFFLKNDSEFKVNFNELQVREKIFECFKKNTNEERDEIFKHIISILYSKHLSCISVCHKNENLDKVIIKALSKLNKEKNVHDLSLVMTWNRIDLAKEHLGDLNQINIVMKFMFFLE